MTYTIKKSDGSFLATIPDNKLDTTSSSISLIGQDVVNYGLYVDQNFTLKLQNFASIEGPAIPLTGQLWYDSNTQSLRVFNSVVWDIVASVNTSAGIITIDINFWSQVIKVVAYISNSQILSIFSYYRISADYLPDVWQVNDTVYTVKALFPNGLEIGENLAKTSNVTLQYYGNASSANILQTAKTISITGEFDGNVQFDGSSNVNVFASFGNVYIGNSNVTVAGTYSNVTVDDTGRIISVGNITYNDIVGALTYVPFSSANVSIDNVPGAIAIRDRYGNFSTNTIIGTTTYSNKFASNITLSTIDAVIGSSAEFNGSANVIIESNLSVVSNLTAGVYNIINVNEYGIVESGVYQDSMPVGSIVLYNNSVVIPEGWAPCNGANVTSPAGDTVTTPNYANVAVGGSIYIMKVFKNLYLPSNDTIVGTLSVDLVGGGAPVVNFVGGPDIKYPPLVYSNVNVASTSSTVSTYKKIKSVQIPNGYRGSASTPGSNLYNGRGYTVGDILYFDFPNYNRKASVVVKEIAANGGISKVELQNAGRYVPFDKNSIGAKPNSMTGVRATGGNGNDAIFDLEVETVNTSTVVEDVEFDDNLFFDAVSIVLSGGDPNAVMLSQTNLFGDISNLTILQIIDNLKLRKQSGLPPRIGKYMLSLDDIKNYAGVMQVPVNTTKFTVALQNRLMVIKVTDIANEYAYQGFYPSDDKIFGACYIGIMQYLAVLKGPKSQLVGNTLIDAGMSPTGMNTIDGLTNEQLITYSSKMIVNAKTAVYNNKVARNAALEINKTTGKTTVPVPPPLVPIPLLTTGNANIIISESVIDGLSVTYGGTKPTGNIQYGGGSFINSGTNINNNVYNSINESRYGSGGEGGGSGSTSPPTSINTGTGTNIPGGAAAPTNNVPQGGTTNGSSVSPVAGGYYGALQGQESGGNYSVFSGNGNYAGDLTTQSFSDMAAAGREYDAQGGPSSAAGGWQFTAGTIEATINSPLGQAAGLTMSSKATVENQNKMVEVFTANNAAAVAAAGIAPTDAAVGGSHVLGAQGYIDVATAAAINPNTPLSSVIGATAVKNNPILGTTVGSAKAYFDKKYGTGQTWKNGVKPSTAVVPPVTTTTLPTNTASSGGSSSSGTKPDNLTPPTVSELANGITKTIGSIASAFSPPPAIVSAVEAVVPQSVKQMLDVAVAATTVAATIAGTIASSATDMLNKALQDSGVQPPVAKTPTAVGSGTTSPAKSSSGSSGGGSYNPSTNGSGGGGGDSGQAANKTPGTISGVSASNNGSISVSAAPSTRDATSSGTYGVSNSPSKPSGGGTGTTSTPSPPAAGSGCFVYETEIEMADGTTKQIGTIRLGDQTLGGEVVAIHCYDGAPLYNYRGVHVSGTHYVIENGIPIMVQDSVHAEKIDNVYGLYTIDTTGRRIFANGIEFADHNGDGVIFEFFKNANRTNFDSESDIYREILIQVKDAKI